uniref:Uncharacterized protein n=1 Tax=Oryza brachyantha TaxID=4533 RepID=J3MDR9_ORYBR
MDDRRLAEARPDNWEELRAEYSRVFRLAEVVSTAEERDGGCFFSAGGRGGAEVPDPGAADVEMMKRIRQKSISHGRIERLRELRGIWRKWRRGRERGEAQLMGEEESETAQKAKAEADSCRNITTRVVSSRRNLMIEFEQLVQMIYTIVISLHPLEKTRWTKASYQRSCKLRTLGSRVELNGQILFSRTLQI